MFVPLSTPVELLVETQDRTHHDGVRVISTVQKWNPLEAAIGEWSKMAPNATYNFPTVKSQGAALYSFIDRFAAAQEKQKDIKLQPPKLARHDSELVNPGVLEYGRILLVQTSEVECKDENLWSCSGKLASSYVNMGTFDQANWEAVSWACTPYHDPATLEVVDYAHGIRKVQFGDKFHLSNVATKEFVALTGGQQGFLTKTKNRQKAAVFCCKQSLAMNYNEVIARVNAQRKQDEEEARAQLHRLSLNVAAKEEEAESARKQLSLLEKQMKDMNVAVMQKQHDYDVAIRQNAALQSDVAASEIERRKLKEATERILNEKKRIELDRNQLKHSLNECAATVEEAKKSQLEVQKARQEVEEIRESVCCSLCLIDENKREYVYLPCSHVCVCYECEAKYQPDKCPICRTNIEQRIRVYIS